MKFILLTVSCIISIEFVIYFKFSEIIKRIFTTYRKIYKIILSKNISDHWKEKVIQAYSIALAKDSFKVLFIIFLLTCIFLFPTFKFNDYLDLIFSFDGFLITVLSLFLYVNIKKFFKNEKI